MQNYVQSLTFKKAFLICNKLNLFTQKYSYNDEKINFSSEDNLVFENMLNTINRDQMLLSCSPESIDKKLLDSQKLLGLSFKQSQQLFAGQISFLHTSSSRWIKSIDTIKKIFGKNTLSFESIMKFSKIMFQDLDNLQETVKTFERVGISKDYSFNNPSILSCTPYSIEAKYMFGVVNNLEQFNLPIRQDLIRQNFNKTVARFRYLQKFNEVLDKFKISHLPNSIIFDRGENFLKEFKSKISENRDILEYIEMYNNENLLLQVYKPDEKYLKQLQQDYKKISIEVFEEGKLKYPMLVLSKDYEQKVLQKNFDNNQAEIIEKKLNELIQAFGISKEKAKVMLKQNKGLFIYSIKAIQDKLTDWSKYFNCETSQILKSFINRPTLIDYDVQTVQQKCLEFAQILKTDEDKFKQILLENLHITTEDTSKFAKKIEDLKQLGYSDEHILDNIGEISRLGYGIKEKFMITQIASNILYQNPRIKGQYQDFNKYFFEDKNVDKIGRCSLALLWAKFKFFYDGINSEEQDKLVVPQAFNTYFINTKDMIKQYANTIGKNIDGFKVDKQKVLINDIPELGLKAGADFETLYPILQSELIKQYPFDKQSYQLLQSEYDKLQNVPKISILQEDDKQSHLITITPQEQEHTICQTKKSATKIVEGANNEQTK